MEKFDATLGLREFWNCLDPNQRDSLLKVNIKDDDETVQCTACRPCYKAAVLALKEKASETTKETEEAKPKKQKNIDNEPNKD